MDSLSCECEWWRVAIIWREEVRSIKSDLWGAENHELGHYWRAIVLHNYFQRMLSHQSDKLVALSALASISASIVGSSYLAGLWREDLHVGLLWDNLSPQSGYMDDRRAIPSWSWASLPLHRLYSPPWISRFGKPMAKVLEATTKPSTVNQFGSVSGGFIKLWGELWNFELATRNFQKTLHAEGQPLDVLQHSLNSRVNGSLRQEICLCLDTSLVKTKVSLPNGARETTFRRIRLDEVQEKHYIAGFRRDEMVHLFMVPIFKRYDFPYGDTLIHGLLLARSFKRPTLFERIGTFFFPEPHESQPGAPHAEKVEQEIIMI